MAGCRCTPELWIWKICFVLNATDLPNTTSVAVLHRLGMSQVYQQFGAETMLQVVLGGGKLREKLGSRSTPRAVSSVGSERLVYTQEVTGSNPVPPIGREVTGSSRGAVVAFREAARSLTAEPTEKRGALCKSIPYRPPQET